MRRFLPAMALSAALAFTLVACSGGSKSPSADSASYTATAGDDNAYVAQVCSAQATLQDAMGNALKDPAKLANAADFDRIYTQPFEKYVAALENARPPSDLVAYHEALVHTLGGIVQNMSQTKQINSLVSQIAKIPQPPKAAASRLQSIAANNADCKRSGFSFTGGLG